MSAITETADASKLEDDGLAQLKPRVVEALRQCDKTGGKKLNLSGCGLLELPRIVIDKYSETLEFLNLGDNQLSELPHDFYRFVKLKILFFLRNNFTTVPMVLGQMQELYMVSFKSNNVRTVPEDSFNSKITWLILTDNKIEKLPSSIGKLVGLRKCALAGNLLTCLPLEMRNCKRLELLRISSNRLQEIPAFLFDLPRLAWLAIAGNPCIPSLDVQPLPNIDENKLVLLERLGEGASGVVWSADWNADSTENTTQVAVKIFKGSVTSDGLPTDEINIFSKISGANFNTETGMGRSQGVKPLPCVLGQTTVDNKLAVVLNLIPNDFLSLGNPPNFSTCTRDTFPEGFELSASAILKIVQDIICAICTMHDLHVAHGDLYAHNIMFAGSNRETFAATLCDFGASTYYHGVSKSIAEKFEKIEVLAFGNLLEDLSSVVKTADIGEENLLDQLQKVQRRCQDSSVSSRPTMSWLKEFISKLP